MAKTHRWDHVTPEDRLRAKMRVEPNGCWAWLPAVNNGGYGTLWLRGRHMTAHRAAYIIFKGEIPAGLEIDHLCRNRRCVNPDHLEAVTRAENLRRGEGFTGRHARQTHCKRGHEFTAANTYISARGERVCRACHAAREWARRNGVTVEQRLSLRSGQA